MATYDDTLMDEFDQPEATSTRASITSMKHTLMDEFDVPATPATSFVSSTPMRYPSLRDTPPTVQPTPCPPPFRHSASASSSASPILTTGSSLYPSIPAPSAVPKYPSFHAYSPPTATTATYATPISDTCTAFSAALPAMAVADASVPTASSSCFPTHAPLVPPVVLDGSSSHYASPPSSPSSSRILDLPPSFQPAPQAVADALKVVHDLEVDEAIDVQHELQTMQSVMHHIDLALRGETPHQIAQRETREAARQERERQRMERQLAQHEQHVQRLASRLAKQPSNVVP